MNGPYCRAARKRGASTSSAPRCLTVEDTVALVLRLREGRVGDERTAT